jgi:hypothetical protein
MTALGHELRMVQNPALGAVILWRFARAYADQHPQNSPAPFCLLALILPMIWHADTATNIHSTREASGLRAFADKFSDSQDSHLDSLLSIHKRAARWRTKTIDSIQMAIGCGLLRIEPAGGVIASDQTWQPGKQPPSVRIQFNNSEKLGCWFARLSLIEIAAILHVRF